MIHFLMPGITRSYSDFPVKAGTDQNLDYCHKLVIRLHRVGIRPAVAPSYSPATLKIIIILLHHLTFKPVSTIHMKPTSS